MSGTKRSIDIDSIRKIFQKQGWDKEFWVMGNLPYNKGTKVFWQPQPGLVILTQEFDNNFQLFEAVLNPQYHPRKAWPPPAQHGLFHIPEWVENTEVNRRLLIKKVLDQWEFCSVILARMGLPVDGGVKKELLKTLRKLT